VPGGSATYADRRRRLLLALIATGVFTVVEAVGGWLAGSLAILADAAHMLTDTGALGFAWVAAAVSVRGADERRSYGYQRVQVLAGFINGLVLVAIVVWIAFEALHRFVEPQPVAGGLMLGIAAAGLLVNLWVFRILHQGGHQHDLNVRGAVLHVLGDLFGSVAAIIAALVILSTGWTPIDPLLSLAVCVLVLVSAARLLREAVHILLEGTPGHVDIAEIKEALREGVPEVDDIHHVHVWALTPEHPLLTLHADISNRRDSDIALRKIKDILRDRFEINHSTVQIETDGCVDHEADDPAGPTRRSA
jgi:cobalt-zinc-cadmium efflux system protein